MAYTLETIQENYQTHKGLGLGNNVHLGLTEEVIPQCTLIPPPNPHLLKKKPKKTQVFTLPETTHVQENSFLLNKQAHGQQMNTYIKWKNIENWKNVCKVAVKFA